MRDETEQLSLINEQEENNKPVVCLGLTFNNEEERREYFRRELRNRLPELKKLEGFPTGNDKDIVALSDPPYYTVCPNPWMADLVKEWTAESKAEVKKKPYNIDVVEGKKEPIYNIHSYHTKVPYKAIMRYLLHYTEPQDVILDGFSGTGMTGFAAQMCGDPKVVKKLGFHLTQEGDILDGGKVISKLGVRKTVLNDLSPIATYISYNYNNVQNYNSFKITAQGILDDLKKDIDWIYKTNHVINGEVQKDRNGKIIKGTVNFTIWSDVFECPSCSHEIIYWESAIDAEEGKVKENILCTNCNSISNRKKLKRVWESKFDKILGQVIKRAKQEPVIIDYTVNGVRYEKSPDSGDFSLFSEIEGLELGSEIPVYELPEGYNTAQPKQSHGISHIHHFYTHRNLFALSKLKEKITETNHPILAFLFSSMLQRATQMNRIHLKNYFFGAGGYNAGYLKGTLYISSLPIETSIIKQFEDRIRGFETGFRDIDSKINNLAISTNSTSSLLLNDNSIDYIFTDPPFGGNLMYSELNFIWESWLKVFTNNKKEAIVNTIQKKNVPEYQGLVTECFVEYYRVLKPGKWITVEFSNSKASVWNAIQDAIQKAGFVIANVAALDKKHGSFKALTTTTAVKQDLVISAYKPELDSIAEITEAVQTHNSCWLFIEQHLEKLSVFDGVKGEARIITERTPRILFDRMVAYHVQNGLPVPISSAEFQSGIAQRFPIRDGMAFLESQIAEYDKKRILVHEFSQMSLFVSDETSAIEWLRQQLMKKPQTRQDLHPLFMKEIQHISKHELLPELDSLLMQNFLKYEGDGVVPDQLVSYLQRNYREFRGVEKDDEKLKAKALNRWYVPNPNKQADLEKLRERTLLREFESYTEELAKNNKKLRQFRTEAIRAGFKKAWSEKDYGKIVSVGDRLPEAVIQEDDKLLMYYDNAQVRLDM